MDKFDITELPQAVARGLGGPGLHLRAGGAGLTPARRPITAYSGSGENAAEQAAQVAEEEGPIEAGQAAEDIVVPVSITMPESVGAEPKTIEVTVADGSTVLQATEAAGWDVQVENSDYGKFVTSINGIANGSEGDASGWVYTVNDEQVMEACDVRQLTAGDSVQWSFYVG
ncbi:MAG: DUF4430 domain-containing protein [Adlercreutzia equolifaciens]